MENIISLWHSTGIYNFTGGQAFMMLVGFLLLFLAIKKGFEPLLLLPIGFGAILSNIPVAGIAEEGGILYYLYYGIKTGLFPLLIFMGVGAMTDFGPMLANPKTLLLGAAAQFGIFASLLGALALNAIPGLEFSYKRCRRNRHYRRCRRPDRYLCGLKTVARLVGRYRGRGILLHGFSAVNTAADHARLNHRR